MESAQQHNQKRLELENLTINNIKKVADEFNDGFVKVVKDVK